MPSVGVPASPVIGQPSVLAFSYPVAMQSHRDPAVGISGMDKALREVKVLLHKLGEGGVGMLISIVGAPVSECHQLPVIQVVGKDGGIVSLHHKLEASAAARDVGLHAVALQYVL